MAYSLAELQNVTGQVTGRVIDRKVALGVQNTVVDLNSDAKK